MRLTCGMVLAVMLIGCSKLPTVPGNRAQRFGVAQAPSGTYRGQVTMYFTARSSLDSLAIVIAPSSATVYLHGLALPTTVDSLTSSAVWLTCRYDDCDLWLRTYPGCVGVGANLDSLRGFATLVPDDTTHVYPYHATPGSWRAER